MRNDEMKVGAVDNGSKSPIKQGEVERGMDAQECLLDSLNKQLGVLEEKLKPIMVDQLSELGNDSERESLCMLANVIRNKNDRIASFIQIVDSINNRIEL